ncbi:DEKNAAC104826 [Brettanomyces naardenensis]|uniref:DEKNAAC104826 n=1 Tax=Brettanomyces naardenensis TaxID=13370 RepID=A0A448YSF6_BRENA|nr:DEKNAAC104826 [Brettanomyces naardenensis]
MPYQLDSTEERLDIHTPKPDSEKFVACILRKPRALTEDPYLNNLAPATHRCAIILHGNRSHKNFCFAVPLAAALSDKFGMYSLRFDFRNCGDSSLNGRNGRTVEEDIEDVEAVYQFLTSGGYHGTKLIVDVIVGHSRGVVDMFEWALHHNDKDHYVPVMIAAAGRFIGQGLIDRVVKAHPDFEKDGGHCEAAILCGKYSEVFVPASETFNLGGRVMDDVSKINPATDTLCIYGTRDGIIPLPDAAMYANALSPRNKLVLINGVDHRYYGVVKLTKEEAAVSKYRYNERTGVLDHNQDVVDTILNFLGHDEARKRFFDQNKMVHKFLPRWKNVEGIANFRDIGGYISTTGKHVRYNLAYRCANVGSVTQNGLETIKSLGIKTVFDLRSAFERQDSGILEADGIENIHVPLFGEQSLSPSEEVMFYTNLMTSSFTFVHVYSDILRVAAPQFKQIFTYIRDHPGEPFIYHCTAGKDRTGVVTMLILRLLDVPSPVVAREYEMTEYGLAPERPKLERKFLRALNERDEESRSKLIKLMSKGRKNWSLLKDGFDNLLSSRYEVMMETIRYVEEEYDAVETYLENQVGLSHQDLVEIKKNLLVE